jgi:hypothetical protein
MDSLFYFLFDLFSPSWTEGFIVIVIEDGSDFFREAPFLNHVLSGAGCAPKIRARSTRDILRAVDYEKRKRLVCSLGSPWTS